MFFRNLLLALLSSTIISCGGSGGDGNSSNSLTGYFHDSAVSGLNYSTSSGKQGITDSLGSFEHLAGDDITFSLGSLELGTAKTNTIGGREIITPRMLAENTKVVDKQKLETLILQTLQSLNANNSANEGISITNNLAISGNISTFVDKQDDFLNQLPDSAKSNNNFSVSKAEAEKHFRAQLYKLEYKKSNPIDLLISSSVPLLNSVTNTAIITFKFSQEVAFSATDIGINEVVTQSEFKQVSNAIYSVKITAKPDISGYAIITVRSDVERNTVAANFGLLVGMKFAQTDFVFDTSAVNKTFGENFSRTATAGQSSNKNITYTSNDTSIATVDQNGTVSVLKAGIVNITATQLGDDSYQTASGQYRLTISKANQTNFAFDTNTVSKTFGENFSRTATAGQSSNKNITYTSSDTSIATVDQNGAIRTLKIGVVNITATQLGDESYQTASGQYTLTINNKANQTNFAFDTNTVSKTFGESFSRTATAGQSSHKNITYTSSNTSIATVDQNGTIGALKAGVVNITATQLGDDFYQTASGQYTLTINKANQTGFSAGNDKIGVTFSSYIQVATGGLSNGAISYSANSDKVNVNENGKVDIGLNAGTVIITATRAGDERYHPVSDNYTLTVLNLGAPSNLRFTKKSNNSVILNWDAATGADSYQVHYAQESFVNIEPENYGVLTSYTMLETNVTTLTIENLTGAGYYFIITAVRQNMATHRTSNQVYFSTTPSDFNQRLKIPVELNPSVDNNKKSFTLYIKKGQYQFYNGINTNVFYADSNSDNTSNNQSLMPTLRMHENDNVQITYHNKLGETTTMHGHGMHLPANQDGGPHSGIENNTTWTATYTVKQKASTNWYHPHLSGKTGEHVYKGLAGMIIVDDAESDALDLPKRYGIDDIPLIVQNRKFNANKQLVYNPTRMEIMQGFKGDTHIINSVIKPFLEVKAKRIRFRILNGSNASLYNFGLIDANNKDKSFQQIASDQAFLEKPVTLTRVLLSPAERAEIVVDFSGNSGKTFILKDFETGAELMQIIVGSSETSNAVPGTLTTLEKHSPINATTRNFVLSGSMGGGGGNGSARFTINGKSFDMSRIDTTMTLNQTEVWTITNNMRIVHNFHIHATHFRVIERGGSASNVADNEKGYKDTVRVDPNSSVKFVVKMIDYTNNSNNPYMYHCHILEHEDNGMMGTFIVE
ncbi:Multicopper oxidase [Bathymodiolus thermophilus thioautotrophic gill symbiont]|uniref:Ig-like domain-containing protein n=1 Tax=Bathymodiolus thermophilus thioautotrophic gill symbiont TaxID=2360 RepID=UPI0010AFB0C0|nr:Ig-like domain-containing protein [Bathymodiolus thermophilus thioautotrophic gill symbiont]SGZ78320.1 Multicopper oxidase [Bathymodiolus thermophilus thioautotrophic gill symbiont]